MAESNLQNTTEISQNNESVFASLGLDAHLFVFQLINFAIVFLVLWFIVLKPLVKMLEQRKNVIDESLDKAKEAETNYMMSEQKYRELVDNGKRDAAKVIEQAHTEAKKLGAEMKVTAKNEIETLVTDAKKHIEEEKDAAMQSVREESASLIALAVEKVVHEKLTSGQDEKMIEDTLREMKK